MKNLLIILIVFLSMSCTSPHDKVVVCIKEVNDSVLTVVEPNDAKITLFIKNKNLPVKKGDFILVRRGEILNY